MSRRQGGGMGREEWGKEAKLDAAAAADLEELGYGG